MFRFISGLLSVVLLFLFCASGCDHPERPRSEYGETVSEFPEFQNGMKILPLPEGTLVEKDGLVQQDGPK